LNALDKNLIHLAAVVAHDLREFDPIAAARSVTYVPTSPDRDSGPYRKLAASTLAC